MRGPRGSSWAGEVDNKLRSALQRGSRSGDAQGRETRKGGGLCGMAQKCGKKRKVVRSADDTAHVEVEG